jgi:hypothetical protein
MGPDQFDHLLVHLDDGLMPIDNNDAEQVMEQVALGRKNWMFIGSVDAGYRAADLMSLVSSAERNDLDVFPYGHADPREGCAAVGAKRSLCQSGSARPLTAVSQKYYTSDHVYEVEPSSGFRPVAAAGYDEELPSDISVRRLPG